MPFLQYAGKYVLVVNVATFWGLTFQYLGKSFRFWPLHQITRCQYLIRCLRYLLTSPSLLAFPYQGIKYQISAPFSFCHSELNALQEELEDLGFVILGFPCNQFGKQEPGYNHEILPILKWVEFLDCILKFRKCLIINRESWVDSGKEIIQQFLIRESSLLGGRSASQSPCDHAETVRR